MSRQLMILSSLLLILLTGCDPEHFRAETKLLPDGSFERAISQPLRTVPAAAQERSSGWREIFFTQQDTKGDLPVRKVPIALNGRARPNKDRAGKSTGGFVAWGTFSEAATIPDHFRLEPVQGFRASQLIRQTSTLNAGFVKEYTWVETLTDVVNLTDQRQARIELAQIGIKLIIAVMHEVWGDEYDLQAVEKWLATEGTDVFQEMCDHVLELGIQKQLSRPELLELKCHQTWKRHGVDLLDQDGHPLRDGQERNRRLDRYLEDVLAKLIKDRAGQPIPPDKLKGFIEASLENERDAKVLEAWQKVLLTQYGGKDQFEAVFQKLAIRILGVYFFPILAPQRTFDYRMEFPGEVIRSNGEVLALNQVRWKFNPVDAYPLGYPMEAVALELNAEAIRQHLPQSGLTSRQNALKFLNLIRDEKQLIAALVTFAATGDANLYENWMREALQKQDHAKAEQIRELLGR